MAVTVLVRDAVPEDLDSLYRLDQLCFEPGIAYSRSQMRSFLRISTARAALTERDGKLAGFAIGYLSRPGVARIITLDVHPDHRRHGIGQALMKEILGRLARDGALETRLEVDARNTRAITFYEKLGFRRGRRLEDYYAPGRPALEMTLPAGAR